MKLVAAVSSAVMAISFAAPALAQPLRDTAIGGANASAQSDQSMIQSQTSTVGDVESGEAMPGNPSVELPDKVASSIPDSATVVSGDHAVTKDGTLKDIETGRTVTDPELVGTKTEQPDPLAKTDGESFIPVGAKTVKTAVKDAAESAEATTETSAASTKGSVKAAALGNNEYGAHWGTHNGVQAFFDAGNNVFAKNAKGVVDVSEWQNTIDWQAAKNAGVEGAIVRIGYGWGNGFDKQAQRNIKELKKLDIPFGVYLYSYAYDSDTAAREGTNVVNLLKKAGVSPSDLEYPVYYDLEAWTWAGHAHPTDPNVYNGIVNAWYSQLQSAGYNNLSVYSYTTYLRGPLNHASIHARTHWVAQYGGYMGFGNWSSKVRGWQYTSGGSVAGMSGRIDLNAFGTTDGSDMVPGNAFNVTKLDAVTIPNGTYYINSSVKDSSSVEIPGGSTANGATTKLYQYNNSKAQQFTFTKQSDGSYEIKNVNSGKALEAANGNGGNGVAVQQNTANGSKAQRWFLRDAGNGYYIQSAVGNYVLDITSGSTVNSTPVRLWTPNGTAAQTFILPSAGVSVPLGNVNIVSALDSKKVVDVYGAAMTDGAQIQIYTSNNTKAQQFHFTQSGNGIYEIMNANSGKLIEVSGGSYIDGASVKQRAGNGKANQRWQVRNAGNGRITLLGSQSNKALDIPYGGTDDLTALWVYTANGSTAQQWTLNKVGADSSKVEVYRMYNPSTKDHIITASDDEAVGLASSGWTNEGVAMHASVKGAANSKPVYRLYNAAHKDHVYTTTELERQTLAKSGWRDEGIAFYAPDNGSVTVYRVYNPATRYHLFTADKNEATTLQQRGWTLEGTAFKAFPA